MLPEPPKDLIEALRRTALNLYGPDIAPKSTIWQAADRLESLLSLVDRQRKALEEIALNGMTISNMDEMRDLARAASEESP